MNSLGYTGNQQPITELLADLRLRGIKLWSENGQLRYRAPKGSLANGEIERLRESRDQIVAVLERGAASPKRLGAYEAPLSFSQLWHWNLFQLDKRHSSRHVVSATRVRGPLHVGVLRKSLAEIVRRHDALRTRIVVTDGVPLQVIDAAVDFDLDVDDLTSIVDDAREARMQRIIEQDILEPIDLAVGPLFAFRLLKVQDDVHVLAVTMDHLITDGYSLNILLRDLFAAYYQALLDRPFSLPEIAVQFGEYASWQRSMIKAWLQQHRAYWEDHLRGYQPVRAPIERAAHPNPGWGTCPVQIGSELKANLQEWCRLQRTTLAMGVFTAYVALISRWCNAGDIVIQHQVNSRPSPKVVNTIGYFTSVLHMRFAIREDDRFVDVMSRVIDEYCRAHEHADFNYLAAQTPRPDYSHSNWFNWIPTEPRLDSFYPGTSEHALELTPLHFANPVVRTFEWDNDPEFVLFDTELDVVGTLYFPLNRFSTESMASLTRNLLGFIEALLKDSQQRVREVPLVE